MGSTPVRNIATALAVSSLMVVVAAVAGPSAAQAASARGDGGTGFTVTFAARSCPSYTAITANRARNNIQESLKDLGANTSYSAGEPIDPVAEEADQPTCTPIPDWQFTLGDGYRTRAVSGPWGSLSIVTGAFSTPIETKAATPLLNTQGQDTGRTLAGAVTVELTRQQLDLAVRSNSLWLQGGTPADPILNVPFPSEYGFGALRCAIDNLNGDNVEWIAFPQGATHVFCYAYYVKPPPTSGTIVVRKQVDAPAGTRSENFLYAGTVSFNPGGLFTVPAAPGAPGEQTFYRAETAPGAAPWTFAERVPAGWTLSGLACTSQTGDSDTTTDVASAAAAVTLAPGDVVTCTYTDTLTPPSAGLLLRKITSGGVGTFGFNVEGEGGDAQASATTTAEGVAAAATPGPLTLAPGDYRIQESLPTSKSGTWKLDSVDCPGQAATGLQPVSLSLAPGAGAVCTFSNRFTPKGAIELRKETVGAVGSAGFVIAPLHHVPPVELAQAATTTREGDPVLATGDDTSALPLGRYVIQETTPSERADGAWSLQSVVCNGLAVPSDQGQVEIALTVARPRVECTYVNRFTPGADPPLPPDPGPDPTPEAHLVVTKRAAASAIRLGDDANYRITVTNRGPAAATDVAVSEQLQGGAVLRSVSASQGHCLRAAIPVCNVGTLRAGQTVTINATARPERPGVIVNRVAAGTATAEASVRASVARARVAVRRRGPAPPFTG